MKEFFLENWKFLLEILLLVVSTIIVILKKTAKVKVPESVLASLLSNIPVWIVQAENEFGSGNGEKKFSNVYKKALTFLCEKMEIKPNEIPDTLLLSIGSFIEEVLATPTKKEDVL